MNVLGAVRDVLQASSRSANRGGDGDGESTGAFWCDDCSVRIRDVELDDALGNEGNPSCPDCGEEMRFERSAAATGCAC